MSWQWIDAGFELFFGDKFKERFEKLIVILSVSGFLIHLAIIALQNLGYLHLPDNLQIFENPISALYTPFSFILLFEVYLLVEQLPKSFTSSVQKQFEIIALILIRRVFKDISHLELSEGWISTVENYHLLLDLLIFLLLFFLIFLFKKLHTSKVSQEDKEQYQSFILFKKLLSVALMPVLAGLVVYEFVVWVNEARSVMGGTLETFSNVNEIFYHNFFVVLICVDVLILLVSLIYISSYSQLIRNSGYIVSTILIRLSFTAEGIYNSVLILLGVAFGVALLFIYNLVSRHEPAAEDVN